MEKYVIGVDFGSDSVRAVVVNASSGKIISSKTAFYTRWKNGLYQHPECGVFRQHPLDYLESLEECVKGAVRQLDEGQRGRIAGIGIDTTGSTPAPVNRAGIPLALTEGFQENENAMFHLWKDHSASKEAGEINALIADWNGVDYSKYQGKYSAEWFWAKILHTVRIDAQIRDAAYTWVEHCEWIVGLLTGKTRPEEHYHSACAAGHKALWHSEWGGFPPAGLLKELDPYLVLVRERYGNAPRPAAVRAGALTKEWAEKLDLPANISVSGSSFDAHAGAVGAGIREGTMVCALGTSAVDMVVEKAENLRGKNIQLFAGQAENSILPEMVGVETGQAAFGDIFAWFKKILMWPIHQANHVLDQEDHDLLCHMAEENMLLLLQEQAAALPDEPFPIALDWFNGRRYPDTDDSQQALIGGLALGIDAPTLYRSLVFGAVCGLKRIVEGFSAGGIKIEEIVAAGGISKKSDYVMQMIADVLDKKVFVLDTDQTCALGAAIYAAVAGGVYQTVEAASSHMAAKRVREFSPDKGKMDFYKKNYEKYLCLVELADRWKMGGQE